MQIHRLFEIVYILLDKKTVTAGELAQHFGVSRRTICRDIDTLSGANIPIYTERGKGGGISLMPNFVLNKSLLSEQEQKEILTALQGLSSIRTDQTDQVIHKLSTVFQKTTTNWIQVDFTGWSQEEDFWSDLKSAILEQHVVQFDYYNSYGEKSLRRVQPLQLWFKARSWYLKAFCLDKQALRLYKLPRMKNLLVTEDRFTATEVDEIVKDSQTEELEKPLAVKLHIGQTMAYRVYDEFYESMVEKQPDGSFIITVSWPIDNWLIGFILSFGRQIKVLEPKFLAASVQEEARKIAENYYT